MLEQLRASEIYSVRGSGDNITHQIDQKAAIGAMTCVLTWNRFFNPSNTVSAKDQRCRSAWSNGDRSTGLHAFFDFGNELDYPLRDSLYLHRPSQTGGSTGKWPAYGYRLYKVLIGTRQRDSNSKQHC